MSMPDGKIYEGTWINGKFNDMDFKDDENSIPEFTEELSDQEF